MGYVLDPRRRLRREVRRVAVERLDDAIHILDRVLDPAADTGDDLELETAVHEVRKRCKSSRGLARLVRPALGDDFATFDRLVRDAANELSTLRDTHALLRTLDTLAGPEGDAVVLAVRDRHARIATGAEGALVDPDDPRLTTARSLLADARRAARRWRVPDGFTGLESGILATYRRGRRGLRRASADPSDERLHEWRKAVKYLWYQMQLVRDAAPSVLEPLGAELDHLAETLGEDHDLAVLLHALDHDPAAYGSPDELSHVSDLARRRQGELRARAFRAGATIYAESAPAFVGRIGRYWELTVTLGPEPRDEPTDTGRQHVERERRFLVHELPDGIELADAVAVRQGYLAADFRRSVRIRDAGSEGCTLTIKAGAGAERTEIEWTMRRDEFDAAWPHTEGQRIEKTRHRIPHGRHLIELDVFGGALDGLIIAEVEFGSAEALADFTPPDWFGPEVTDDGRYTNASLALHGLPT